MSIGGIAALTLAGVAVLIIIVTGAGLLTAGGDKHGG